MRTFKCTNIKNAEHYVLQYICSTSPVVHLPVLSSVFTGFRSTSQLTLSAALHSVYFRFEGFTHQLLCESMQPMVTHNTSLSVGFLFFNFQRCIITA